MNYMQLKSTITMNETTFITVADSNKFEHNFVVYKDLIVNNLKNKFTLMEIINTRSRIIISTPYLDFVLCEIMNNYINCGYKVTLVTDKSQVDTWV